MCSNLLTLFHFIKKTETKTTHEPPTGGNPQFEKHCLKKQNKNTAWGYNQEGNWRAKTVTSSTLLDIPSVFPNSFIHLHSQRQCTRVPVASHPHHIWYCQLFFIFASPMDMQQCLSVGLICLSEQEVPASEGRQNRASSQNFIDY